MGLGNPSSLNAAGTHSGTITGGLTFPLFALTCKSRNSNNLSTNAPVGRSKASMLLCPAPSTQNGLERHTCCSAKNNS